MLHRASSLVARFVRVALCLRCFSILGYRLACVAGVERRRGRENLGARGRKERNPCKDAIVFSIFLSAEFYRLVLKSVISHRLVGFTRRKKERKNHAACVLLICCLTRVINGKIIEDEASHNFWWFLVEDFFLPVIKRPGTYFNNKLLPSCRSSKFSSSFPASSIRLCAPLDLIRPDRNSKSAWR